MTKQRGLPKGWLFAAGLCFACYFCLCIDYHHSAATCTYAYSYNLRHHIPPTHNASCTSASRVFMPEARRKSTTSTICSGWWPLHVQVEYLSELMEGKTTSAKCKGPVQFGVGCSNNMQLQPPPPKTRSGPARSPFGVPDAAICIRACRG